MTAWLAVAAGGALGAMARYGVSLWLPTRPGGGLPWATLLVNVIGSAILGALAGMVLSGRGSDPNLRLALGTGFCGALTTFSTFSVETVVLLREGHVGAGLLYVGANLLVCLGIAAGTYALTAAR